ncbi:MAG: hypothetical protein HUK04_00360 [Bacteroidaceae bacterium]|nr:hypothetical protein [Bacteroidaceae bacterium]
MTDRLGRGVNPSAEIVHVATDHGGRDTESDTLTFLGLSPNEELSED